MEEEFVGPILRFCDVLSIMRPKLDEFATLKEMPFSLKKDAITASPSLDPDFCDPFNENKLFHSL